MLTFTVSCDCVIGCLVSFCQLTYSVGCSFFVSCLCLSSCKHVGWCFEHVLRIIRLLHFLAIWPLFKQPKHSFSLWINLTLSVAGFSADLWHLCKLCPAFLKNTEETELFSVELVVKIFAESCFLWMGVNWGFTLGLLEVTLFNSFVWCNGITCNTCLRNVTKWLKRGNCLCSSCYSVAFLSQLLTSPEV